MAIIAGQGQRAGRGSRAPRRPGALHRPRARGCWTNPRLKIRYEGRIASAGILPGQLLVERLGLRVRRFPSSRQRRSSSVGKLPRRSSKATTMSSTRNRWASSYRDSRGSRPASATVRADRVIGWVARSVSTSSFLIAGRLQLPPRMSAWIVMPPACVLPTCPPRTTGFPVRALGQPLVSDGAESQLAATLAP